MQFFYTDSVDFDKAIVIQLDEEIKINEWLQYINEGMKESTYLLCADKGGF